MVVVVCCFSKELDLDYEIQLVAFLSFLVNLFFLFLIKLLPDLVVLGRQLCPYYIGIDCRTLIT